MSKGIYGSAIVLTKSPCVHINSGQEETHGIFWVWPKPWIYCQLYPRILLPSTKGPQNILPNYRTARECGTCLPLSVKQHRSHQVPLELLRHLPSEFVTDGL